MEDFGLRSASGSEYIHIDKAWDITTGSKDFLIGITDKFGIFHYKHEDLDGRFSEVINTKEINTSVKEVVTHGTGVAGAIGAISNNGIGMSGINWTTQLVGGKGNYAGLLETIEKDKVLLSSNSWALAGHIPNDFNSTDDKMVEKRNEKVLNGSRKYLKLTKKYENKLFVWSAGNGVGNGASTSGFYGVDGRHYSSALHYSKEGLLKKQNNVIFVSALSKDSKLVYSSNWGESIDIAAPTGYKSTKKDNNGTVDDYYEGSKYGTNKSGGFTGTSAATPVVAGVASLIFSLNKDFTGGDVKSILINSATNTVKKRYLKPGNDSKTVELQHEIPILNAESALKMAEDIVEGKIAKVSQIRIYDTFKPEAIIVVSSANSKLKTKQVSFDLATSTDGNQWTFINSFSGTNEVEIPLNTDSTKYRLTGSATLDGISVKATFDEEFMIPRTTLSIQDSISLAPIPNAFIEIEPMFFNFALSFLKRTGTVNDKGKANLYLWPGNYKFIVSSNDYMSKSTKIVTILEDEVNKIQITMGEVGNLGGKVLDISGEPIVGATVRLSGGEQTNGFVYSATTDSSGTYNISNISKKDDSGNPIVSFTLSATATGYKEEIEENVVIITASSVNYNFTLGEKEPTSETVIYSTSFEANENSWTGTGLWHIQELKTDTSVVNTLVDNGFVTSPPDEDSDRAYLPKADDGDSVMWYGLSDTGSFINTQTNGDSLKSGGKSTSSHSGTITSPSIDLTTSTQPILRFKTWWEIEAVSPNENGYDLMDVKISVDDGAFTTIKRLNPQVDSNMDDRKHKGFSSAGVFRKPIWVLEELDLSEYIGHTVRIQFSFDTKDELYNGFRGWLIDDLSIIEGTVVNNSVAKTMNKSYQKINIPKQTIFDGLSEEYIRVHKKPIEIKESQSFR